MARSHETASQRASEAAQRLRSTASDRREVIALASLVLIATAAFAATQRPITSAAGAPWDVAVYHDMARQIADHSLLEDKDPSCSGSENPLLPDFWPEATSAGSFAVSM